MSAMAADRPAQARKPWYREPWPWLLMAGPAIVVVAGVTTAVIAFRGADGLVALPFLMAERAPLWNPTIPGAFLGVRRSHTREYFVRAAVEGVALMLSTIVDELDRVSPIRQIRATGGVFRSTVWRDVLAAAMGKPLVVTDGAEGTALGAAALALYGLGEAASLRDALIALGQDPDAGSDELVPDPDDVAAYRAVRAGIPALLARYDGVRTLFS